MRQVVCSLMKKNCSKENRRHLFLQMNRVFELNGLAECQTMIYGRNDLEEALNPNFLFHQARVCYGKQAQEQKIHMVGHISNHEAIPTHQYHASIIFQEAIPKNKSFATPRGNFASNYVSEQMEVNLTVREAFFHHRSKFKNLLHILQRGHGFRAMSRLQVSQENFCTSGVTLGFFSFS